MRTVTFLSLLAVLAAGCGGGSGRETAPARDRESALPVVAPAALAASRCTPGEERRVGTKRIAYAASAKRAMFAFTRPGGGRTYEFGELNVNGVRTVFGVLAVVDGEGCEPAWYRVQLPTRPNGATGYVRAVDVELHRVRTRIEVDLSERRIDFFFGGRRTLRVATAVGASATPTPTGRYYVNQRLVASDPSGPFGPGGIGISAFSPVLTGWVQGGPIAIHGTNAPSSIGQAVSNGCLRIRNSVLRRVFDRMVEGTPVVIRA